MLDRSVLLWFAWFVFNGMRLTGGGSRVDRWECLLLVERFILEMKLDTECIGKFSLSLFYLPLQSFLSLQCSQKVSSIWTCKWRFLVSVCCQVLASVSCTDYIRARGLKKNGTPLRHTCSGGLRLSEEQGQQKKRALAACGGAQADRKFSSM